MFVGNRECFFDLIVWQVENIIEKVKCRRKRSKTEKAPKAAARQAVAPSGLVVRDYC